MAINGIYYVYLLYLDGVEAPAVGCSGSRDTYVGMAPDPHMRLQKHNSGSVTATRGRKWRLKALVPCRSRSEAAIVERWLKNGDTRQKRLRMATTFLMDEKPESITVRLFVEDAILWHNVRKLKKQHVAPVKELGNVR